MATNGEKMIQLVKDRVGYGLPSNPPGFCVVRDDSGKDMLKLGFDAHRDFISVIGYEAADEVSVDICAALAALCKLAEKKPVMTAYTLTEADLILELSDDGELDPVNQMAVSLAMAMLKEAILVYSKVYAEKKASGVEWHGNV